VQISDNQKKDNFMALANVALKEEMAKLKD